MKFLMFADLHHAPGVFMGGTWEDLQKIQERAEAENVDFIIHAGDFCHDVSKAADYIKAYNEFHIPSYHCLGNHDCDGTSYQETLKAYNMPDGHYFFDCKGYRFIIYDPNYCYYNGEYIHYDGGNYFAMQAARDYVPPEQLAWLEKTIEESPYPCVMISHESIEREFDCVKNRQDVRDIINNANKKNPGRVLMVINGHTHRDFIRIMDGVCYWDVNSASFDWLHEIHDLYPKELCDQIEYMNHILVYNDPLFAVVTLEGNTIQIDGCESSLFMGVTREMTGNNRLDGDGRPCVPTIQSAKITLG